MLRILGFVCFIVFSQQINAQCCSAGNPSSSGAGSMAKNYLSVSSSFVHSYADTYFTESIKNDLDYLAINFDFGLLNFSYGINDKLSVSTEIGYFFNKSKTLKNSDYKAKTDGIGDAAIDLRYNIINFKKQLTQISANIKTYLPIGEFNKIEDNVRLPIDFQPSSGGFKLKTSINISKQFYGSKFSVNSVFSSTFSQRVLIRTNYKYGNLYELTINTSHRTSKKISTGLGVNFVKRNVALEKDNVALNTGGVFLNLQPRLGFVLINNYNLFTLVKIPIYRKVIGTQLTNKYIVLVGVSKGFDLLSNTIKPLFSDILLQSFNENSFFVDGICGMCKTRIEDLAYSVKGVKWAEWDLKSKQLVVKFEVEINTQKLAKKLSKGGHDNWMFTAKNKVYNNLHSCCKYRVEH